MEIFCWINRMKENKINMFCKMKFGNKNVNLVDCFIFNLLNFMYLKCIDVLKE